MYCIYGENTCETVLTKPTKITLTGFEYDETTKRVMYVYDLYIKFACDKPNQFIEFLHNDVQVDLVNKWRKQSYACFLRGLKPSTISVVTEQPYFHVGASKLHLSIIKHTNSNLIDQTRRNIEIHLMVIFF